MISNKSEIINKLFFNELQELIARYNSIDEQAVVVIEKIYQEIENKYIREYILRDNSKLDEIISEYKNSLQLDIDKIIFWGWYNLNIEEKMLYEISNYYKRLLSEKYIDNENYLIYKNKEDLKEYARDELEYMLDSDYHIDRLLDKDVIIDLWLNGTTKEELMEEVMSDYDIEDILDLSPEYAFTFTDGIEYVFSSKE